MDRIEPGFAFRDLEPDETWIEGDDDIVSVGDPIPHVVHVEAIDDATLFVRFDNGVEGQVEFMPSYLHGVWEKLRDPIYFRRVGVAWGAVSWPNEDPDMAPDRMHDEIVAGNGKWLVN